MSQGQFYKPKLGYSVLAAVKTLAFVFFVSFIYILWRASLWKLPFWPVWLRHCDLPMAIVSVYIIGRTCWLNTVRYYICAEGVTCDLFLVPSRCAWQDMEAVTWNPEKRHVGIGVVLSPSRYTNTIFLTIRCPLSKAQSFKEDVLKYAPEGNPLREWVESGQFDEIHR